MGALAGLGWSLVRTVLGVWGLEHAVEKVVTASAGGEGTRNANVGTVGGGIGGALVLVGALGAAIGAAAVVVSRRRIRPSR